MPGMLRRIRKRFARAITSDPASRANHKCPAEGATPSWKNIPEAAGTQGNVVKNDWKNPAEEKKESCNAQNAPRSSL